MPATVPLLIISGSMGAGKTTVLSEASDLLAQADIPHAAIDLDWLAVMHPQPQRYGERLAFEARDGAIVDVGTGSTWNVLGQAVEGPLAGSQLEPVVSGSHFWFAWSVFKPGTRVILTSS